MSALLGLIFACLFSCDSQSKVVPTSKASPPQAESSPYSCESYEGDWEVQIYKDMKESEVVCDNIPCEGGNFEGYIKVQCTDNILRGTIQFGYSSKTQKESSGSVDFLTAGPKTKLSFVDFRRCKVNYDVEMRGDYMVGSYGRNGCAFKASYETELEFKDGTNGGVILLRAGSRQ